MQCGWLNENGQVEAAVYAMGGENLVEKESQLLQNQTETFAVCDIARVLRGKTL